MFNSKDGLIKSFCLIVGIVFPLSVLASGISPDRESTVSWLQEWTNWVASVVGIIVAAKALWAGGEVVNEYALNKKAERQISEANLKIAEANLKIAEAEARRLV